MVCLGVCVHTHMCMHTWYSSWSVTFTFLDLRFNVFHYNIYEKSLDHYHYKYFFPSFSFPVFWRQLHSHVYWTCWYCITILGCNSVLFTLYVCVPVFVVAINLWFSESFLGYVKSANESTEIIHLRYCVFPLEISTCHFLIISLSAIISPSLHECYLVHLGVLTYFYIWCICPICHYMTVQSLTTLSLDKVVFFSWILY